MENMPKLNATKAAEVKAAGEAGSKFALLPEGKYRVKLIDVESATSRNGNPMWVWKFDTQDYLDGLVTDEGFTTVDGPDGEEQVNIRGKELWYRTTIQDKTLWDLDRVFAAFDSDPDTDTDELIGDEVIVFVDQAIITAGKSKGKIGNNITEFFTLKDGLATGDTDDEPDF